MKRGTIFFAQGHKEAVHPIIFWEEEDSGYFVGLMITHSSGYGNLNLTSEDYYESGYENFKKTYMVSALLLKPVDWLVDPTIKGQLSTLGIYYVNSIVKDLKKVTWDEYLTI